MRGIPRKFYNYIAIDTSYNRLLKEVLKAVKYLNGAIQVETLLNLPLDQLFELIELENEIAAEERRAQEEG